MFSLKSRLRTIAFVSALILAIPGCSESSSQEQGDAKDHSQVDQQVNSEKWDTGIFESDYETPKSEYIDPENPDRLTEAARDAGGRLAESNQIGRNMLLPYEIDSSLALNSGSGSVLKSNQIYLMLDPVAVEAIAPFDDKLESGYRRVGREKNSGRGFGVAVLRYDSAATAKQVMHELGGAMSTPHEGVDFEVRNETLFTQDALLAEDTYVRNNDFNPLGNLTYSSEHVTPNQDLINTVVTTYDEFLLYAVTGRGSSDDQKLYHRYIEEYFEKQIKMLEEVDTHKTISGYGKSSGYARLNSNGLLKYVVITPKPYRFGIKPPESLNARSLAAVFENVDLELASFKSAGVENGAVYATVIAETISNESAASYVNGAMARAIGDDGKEYADGQKLPNVRCVEHEEKFDVSFVCYSSYEKFVLIGSEVFYKAQENKVEFSDDATSENDKLEGLAPNPPKDREEAKLRLSQKMAAQILKLDKAKALEDELGSDE